MFIADLLPPKLETTQMSNFNRVEKKIVAYSYNEILVSKKKKKEGH